MATATQTWAAASDPWLSISKTVAGPVYTRNDSDTLGGVQADSTAAAGNNLTEDRAIFDATMATLAIPAGSTITAISVAAAVGSGDSTNIQFFFCSEHTTQANDATLWGAKGASASSSFAWDASPGPRTVNLNAAAVTSLQTALDTSATVWSLIMCVVTTTVAGNAFIDSTGATITVTYTAPAATGPTKGSRALLGVGR